MNSLTAQTITPPGLVPHRPSIQLGEEFNETFASFVLSQEGNSLTVYLNNISSHLINSLKNSVLLTHVTGITSYQERRSATPYSLALAFRFEDPDGDSLLQTECHFVNHHMWSPRVNAYASAFNLILKDIHTNEISVVKTFYIHPFDCAEIIDTLQDQLTNTPLY